MFPQLKFIASLAILAGTLLLLAGVGEEFNLYNIPYILIIVGLVLLVVSLLATKREKSWVCRIGWHRYEQVGREFELPGIGASDAKKKRKS